MSPSQGITSSSLLMSREQGKKRIVETLMSSESLEVHTCWLREPRNTSRIYVVENRCPKQVTNWTCTTNATHMCESMTIWTRKPCLVKCYEHGHTWDGVLHEQAIDIATHPLEKPIAAVSDFQQFVVFIPETGHKQYSWKQWRCILLLQAGEE